MLSNEQVKLINLHLEHSQAILRAKGLHASLQQTLTPSRAGKLIFKAKEAKQTNGDEFRSDTAADQEPDPT